MGFHRLIEEKQRRREARRIEARKEAERLSRVLSRKFPFQKLYLVGSTLKKHKFGRHSDIDLVIEGLPDKSYLKAYALLLRESGFPVDLKPWEMLDRRFRETVQKEGAVIYEKK